MKTLNEVYKTWKTTGGFFHYLYYYFTHQNPQIECDFLSSDNDALLLDIKYHGSHSGGKYTSTLFHTFADEMVDFEESYFLKFAEIFWKLNSENLIREYEIMQAEYNPLNNYDMTESATDTHNNDSTVSHTGVDTVRNSGTDTNRTNKNETTENNIFGFDTVSNDGVQSDKNTITADSENNYVQTEYGHINTTEYGANHTTDENGTTWHNLTRSGNIGVTTSTQMLQQHADFWDKWNFYESVLFPAVDKLLTIPIY